MQSKENDKDAFEKLMNIYLKVIYNYIAIHVSVTEDVKDILQETMLSVWLSIKNFNNQSTFKTWVLAITKRKIADYYRFVYGNTVESVDEYEDVLETTDYYEDINDQLVVQDAIKVLSKSEREILYLVFNAELNYSEVSEITGIPVGTIKSKIARIKVKLRKKIGEIT